MLWGSVSHLLNHLPLSPFYRLGNSFQQVKWAAQGHRAVKSGALDAVPCCLHFTCSWIKPSNVESFLQLTLEFINSIILIRGNHLSSKSRLGLRKTLLTLFFFKPESCSLSFWFGQSHRPCLGAQQFPPTQLPLLMLGCCSTYSRELREASSQSPPHLLCLLITGVNRNIVT